MIETPKHSDLLINDHPTLGSGQACIYIKVNNTAWLHKVVFHSHRPFLTGDLLLSLAPMLKGFGDLSHPQL